MKRRQKVVLICADGAEPHLLAQWGAAGELPHLTALAAAAATTEPSAPAGFGDGVAWPSLFTGTSPAKHGRYFRIQMLRDYRFEVFDDDAGYGRLPFWKAASERYRVAVIDPPNGPLLHGMSGLQVIDWLVHDPVKTARSVPADAIEQFQAQYGSLPKDYRESKGNAAGRSPENIREFTVQLVRQIEMKSRALASLLESDQWDVVVCGFQELHDAGHELWHVHDPRHIDHVAEVARQTGDPLLATYRALDEAIGRVVSVLDDRDFLFVVGGLGMESCYTGNHLLDEVLARIDGNRGGRARVRPQALRDIYRRVVPESVRDRLRKIAAHADGELRVRDRSRRRFFQVPNNHNAGAVRINVIGREAHGLVSPGEEYAQVCDELCERLAGVVNVETGKPAVAQIIRTRAAHRGEELEQLPDLLVIWNRDEPIRALTAPLLGEIRQHDRRPRTGDHSPRAIALFRGPGIAAGKIEEPTTMMDVGVSIAAILGVEIPDADGKRIAALATQMGSSRMQTRSGSNTRA
jgi:predicted AlkP superfamily phosphohydrolase/phosphomutase